MIHLDVLTKFQAFLGSLNRVARLEVAARAAGVPIPEAAAEDADGLLAAAMPIAALPAAVHTPPAPAAASGPARVDHAVGAVTPVQRPRSPSRSTSAEAVYRAVIGADEPLSLRQIADATRLSKPSLYRAIRRLLEEARLYRGGPESSQHARYAVTQTAADAAYRRLRA